ncbi:MAG: hypothetical protein NVS9B10_01970 [Nevskia sp.]
MIADRPLAECLNGFSDLDAMSRGLESWRARLARMEEAAGRSGAVAALGPVTPRERLAALRQRLAVLAELLARARAENARQLKDFVLAELAARNARIDRYLLAARSALAGRYDLAAHIDARREVSIKKGDGAAADWLPHGEFDIDDPDRPPDE